MKELKCEHCIHKKVCIDGANYRKAERCGNFVNENDIVTVKHGEWEHHCICSICQTACGPQNEAVRKFYNYCPNCGAKMDGGD